MVLLRSASRVSQSIIFSVSASGRRCCLSNLCRSYLPQHHLTSRTVTSISEPLPARHFLQHQRRLVISPLLSHLPLSFANADSSVADSSQSYSFTLFSRGTKSGTGNKDEGADEVTLVQGRPEKEEAGRLTISSVSSFVSLTVCEAVWVLSLREPPS